MQHDALNQVIQRFSEFPRDEIERRFAEDPLFREVCEDYADCIRMRQRYSQAATDRDAPSYAHDYEVLIEALEEEITMFLTTSDLQR